MTAKHPERVLRIADAANTLNPALSVLRDKGFHLYVVPHREAFDTYWAIKDRRDFIADDPLRLLGLVALWEHLGDDWRDRVSDDILSEIGSLAVAEDDFANLDDETFKRLVAHLRLLFDASWRPFPDHVTRTELARLVRTLGDELSPEEGTDE